MSQYAYQQQPTPQETIYYSDPSGLTITATRAIFGPKTFYLTRLTSVNVTEIPVNKLYPSILMTVGILILLSVMREFRAGATLDTLAGLGIAVLCLAGAGACFYLEKPYYVLKLGSQSGDADMLKSKDREYLYTVSAAINQAILGLKPL